MLQGFKARLRGRGHSVVPRPESRLKPARDVLGAERDGLIVLLDLRREVYLGLDEVGSAIWRAIETGARLQEIQLSVAAEFEAPAELIERDTARFVEDLANRGLISLS
jgi:hypothetical protein